MRDYLKKIGAIGRTITLIIITIIMYLVAFAVGEVSAVYIYGMDAVAKMNVSVLQYLHGILTVGAFLIPPILLAYFCCNSPLKESLLINKFDWVSLLICVIIILVATPMVTWLEEYNLRLKLPEQLANVEDWMRQKESEAQQLTNKFLASPSTTNLIVNLIVMALLPAAGEEMYFRLGIQSTILSYNKKINPILSVILTAFIFSSIHLQFFGFWPRFVLGAILGFMLLYTNSIWCPLAAHFVNNACAVLIAWKTANGHTVSISQIETSHIGALISTVLCISLIYLLKIRNKKFNKKVE